MKIEWMFDLPTDERSQDYHYESPILIKDNNLYFISCHPEAVLYVIDTETGTEKFRIECVGQSVISSKCIPWEAFTNTVVLVKSAGEWAAKKDCLLGEYFGVAPLLLAP